jgi:microcystin-dependent protein
MALRQRNFFFDPTNTDRFNSQDIPTEQTMSDWCDSVPFIKEPTDRAQQTRAGIAKTTSDAKINAGDNTDAAGVSPLGFTTFVRPAQIPKILNSPSVTWTKVPRGGATLTDTGVGIEDWQASVLFPVDPVETTITVELHDDYVTRQLTGTFPCSITETNVTTPQGELLNTQLQTLENAIHNANVIIEQLCNALCDSQDNQVALGDIVMSITPPISWNNKWAEPAGQPLLIADHPELYAIFGLTYGVAPSPSTHFLLPDMVSEQNYLKVKVGGGILTPLNGGQFTKTLVEDDLPKHIHTVTGSTSFGGKHDHTFPVFNSGTPNQGFVDGHPGDTPFQNYTTPEGGEHSHSISGITNDFGKDVNDPVYNTNTSNTPRFTNVYLKMRVKP